MPEFKRTVKVIEAIARGIELCTTDWISESSMLECWRDSEEFPLCTEKAEK